MRGRLIYLIGPSGAGKDSLLDAARESLAGRGVRIARRVITRSAEAVGEAAHSVSPQAFERLEAQGALPSAGGPTVWRMAFRQRSMSGWRPASRCWSTVRAATGNGTGALSRPAGGAAQRRAGRVAPAPACTRAGDGGTDRVTAGAQRAFAGELDDYIRTDNSTPLTESVERLLALIDEHVPRTERGAPVGLTALPGVNQSHLNALPHRPGCGRKPGTPLGRSTRAAGMLQLRSRKGWSSSRCQPSPGDVWRQMTVPSTMLCQRGAGAALAATDRSRQKAVRKMRMAVFDGTMAPL